MQKFGLDTVKAKNLGQLELEIMQDHASALGQAGRKLKNVLKSYQLEKKSDFPGNNEDSLIQSIADAVYHLMLQREFIGFVEDNIKWIQKSYDIPQDALKRLGAKNK